MSGIAAVPGRGRKPKPQELKRMSGNPGKRALNNQAPEFTELINVEVPDYMIDLEFASMMWGLVVPELLKNKILCLTDMHNVEAFCIAYQTFRKAQIEVALHGVVVEGAQGGPVKNPALTALNEASKQMSSFGAMLGLDPSSRQRLTGGGSKPKSNSFADVMNM